MQVRHMHKPMVKLVAGQCTKFGHVIYFYILCTQRFDKFACFQPDYSSSMDTDDHRHIFLFSSGNEKKVTSVRATHIRRLFDILHVSLQHGDSHRARRAWAILARCKEVDWKEKWRMSLRLLDSGATLQSNSRKIEFLRTIMLQSPNQVSRHRITTYRVVHSRFHPSSFLARTHLIRACHPSHQCWKIQRRSRRARIVPAVISLS